MNKIKWKILSSIIITATISVGIVVGLFYSSATESQPINQEIFFDYIPPLEILSLENSLEFVLTDALRNNQIRIQDETIKLVNKERAKINLAPFVRNKILDKSAELKGEYLIKEDLFQHKTRYGRGIKWSFEPYIKDKGNWGISYGENLVKGYFLEAKNVVKAWLDSPSHKKLMFGEYEDVGVYIGTYKQGETLGVLHVGIKN